MNNINDKINLKEIDECLKNNVIEKILEIWKEPYENVTWDLSLSDNTMCFSILILANVYFKGKKTSNKSEYRDKCFQLVIKKPGYAEVGGTSSNSLFHNEILFYESVSRDNNDFPRCFFCLEDKNDYKNTIIVMENIEIMGYEVYPHYELPFEYIISSMEIIGKFHAMAYTMKENESDVFSKIINNIEECRWTPENNFCEFVNVIGSRPVEWLRKQHYDSIFLNKIENYMNEISHIVMRVITPVEPLAVLCHGDFTKNNILFRITGTKIESMLIDFAMMRYASPSIDISTLLYLNCNKNDRRQRFDEIFKAYHNSLINELKKRGVKNLTIYSYENILEDYKRGAIYGFIISLFFLPYLRGYASLNQDDTINFQPVKSGKIVKELGGDVLSKEFGEILIELRETGYLDHIIDS